MKNLRLRTYDNRTGQMIDDFELKQGDERVLMHSIGIKDINGKDIYKDDILEFEQADFWGHDILQLRGVVEYNESAAAFWVVTKDKEAVKSKIYFSEDREIRNPRVIGNIHQHTIGMRTHKSGKKSIKSTI